MKDNQYYVYIMTTEKNTALYTGITNDLLRRVYEHKNNFIEGFTKQYNIHKLVYYESGENIVSVIKREKQIKSWKREKKLSMISAFNPDWRDLYDELLQTG